MSICAKLSTIHFSYSLTVFSPSGKLVQIEHALAAVSQGTTSLGIKGGCYLTDSEQPVCMSNGEHYQLPTES